ncbi:MAG: hypothetical protein CMC18_00600 [Flavobacteriaceae bacterium]|nr:hypothetical protein [Flavobacteriaceae bacterium]
MRKIISTKTLSASDKNHLLQAGVSLIEYDTLKIETLPFSIASNYDTYLFSSQNAIVALKQYWKNQNTAHLHRASIYCVGEKTAQGLKDLGLSVLKHFDNAQQLIEFLKTQDFKSCWLHGNYVTPTLEQWLRAKGSDSYTVYLSSMNKKKFADDYSAVLFFSPRGVESFASENNLTDKTAFCIGETTASKARTYTPDVVVAKSSTSTSLVLKLIQHYKAKNES